MATKEKVRDPYRLTVGKQLGWSGRAVSLASNVTVLTYITFYCTNMLGMAPVLVGTLLMASKIFDGVTDLAAGVLIDRTNTKWGKARPYEFSIFGVWIATILLFSCPELGTVGKSIWVFLTYTFVNSIFATLLNASEAVYLVRAFKYDDDRNKLVSVNGLLVTLGATVISIVFPILMGTLGTSRGGWTTMMLIVGIPLALIGFSRFLVVKEINDEVSAPSTKLEAKDFLPALKNKYVWILVINTLLVFMIQNGNSAVGTYYFQYIVGDVTLMSTVGMLGLVSPFLLLFMPKLLQKISITQLFSCFFVIGAVGGILRQFAGANMALIMISSILLTLALLPPSYFNLILITYIMDYHEWKTGNRVEGVIAAINSFSSKLAGGLASGGVGLIMGMAGFDGTAAVITGGARAAIVALYGIVPGVLFIACFIVIHFFDLEKKLPQIRSELAQRRAAKIEE